MNVRFGSNSAKPSAPNSPRSERGKHAVRSQAGADFAGRRWPGASDDEIARAWRWRLDRLSDQAALRPRQPGGRALRRARALEQAASSRAKRRRSWSRRLFQTTAGPRTLDARTLAGELVSSPSTRLSSRETVPAALSRKRSQAWRKGLVVHSADRRRIRRRMEDVLDLYAEEPDPKRPVVCFDESPNPADRRGQGADPASGQSSVTTAVQAQWTATCFIFLDVHRPWRSQSHREPRRRLRCLYDASSPTFTFPG